MNYRILSLTLLFSFNFSYSGAQFFKEKAGIDLIVKDYTNKFDKTSLEQYENNKEIAYSFMLRNDKCNSSGFYVIGIQINNNAKKPISILSCSIRMPFLSREKTKAFFDIDSYSTLDLFFKDIKRGEVFCLIAPSIIEIVNEKYKRHSFFDFSNKKINWLNYPATTIAMSATAVYAGYRFYKMIRDNKRITKNYKKWLLDEKTIIQPGQSVLKLFFIAKNDFKSKFDLDIYNENGSQVISTFKVNLI